MDWIDAQDERDENGNLTPLAIALDAIESNGCDCPALISKLGTCLACRCEKALHYLWEKLEALKNADR